MNEDQLENNSNNINNHKTNDSGVASYNVNQKKTSRNQIIFLKVAILFTLIFLSLFAFIYWQDLAKRRSIARIDSEKFNNLDSDIFDLSQDLNEQTLDEGHGIGDFNIADLKEKNAEFIYQLLIKNQVQIEDLRKQNREFKNEFAKYKSYEKFNKMVITYAMFRDKLFSGKDIKNDLQNLELICAFDENIQGKITKLKSHIGNFLNQKQLENNLKNLIPQLKAIDNLSDQDNGWLNIINQKIAKIIVIRRTVSNSSGDIDDKILSIENYLKSENYQEALTVILSLDQNYNEVFRNFLENLNASLEVQKIDNEILNYLKSLN